MLTTAKHVLLIPRVVTGVLVLQLSHYITTFPYVCSADPHAGQDVRTCGRNADVPIAEGLVVVGAAECAHRKIALPGHLPVSAHESTG